MTIEETARQLLTQIGKVFLVRRHGLRECLVCGELFTRATAPDARRGELLPGCRVLFDANHQKEGSMSLSKRYHSRWKEPYHRIDHQRLQRYILCGSRCARGDRGRTSERFNTVRDAHRKLVSINSSDPGLLIGARSSTLCQLPRSSQLLPAWSYLRGNMTMRSTSSDRKHRMPACAAAQANSTRAEVLDRLGVKDFARVAQLSAEEAFRLLQSKHDREHQTAWSRFETELTKRTAEIRDRHKDELRSAQSERDDLTRRVEDCLREVAQLRERNQELETEMAKVARVGKREEMDFADEARTWAGIAISEKLPRNGDFLLSYRAPNGDPTEPKILIDNKDKSTIAESDIDKLVRDARERSIGVAALVARDETSFGKLTGNRDGAARTESGCFEPPGSGLSAISTC